MADTPPDLTLLLGDVARGDTSATDRLLPQVYDALRRIARQQLRGERPGHTLDTSALVHEAYLKLVRQDNGFDNRAHFYAIAAMAMRRILINYAHKRRAAKRGGGVAPVTFLDEVHAGETPPEALIALDEALDRLARLSERQSRVVTYHFFGGLTHEEIAGVLGISVPTVRRDWRLARAWLATEMGRPPAP